jgi:sulfite reductase (NADPH) flavoprotein alpha-component
MDAKGAIVTGGPDFSLLVAYGSDMGNAEDAAMTFAEAVAAIGVDVDAIELNQIEVGALQSVTHFVVVTSTFGDGEFPIMPTCSGRRSAPRPTGSST